MSGGSVRCKQDLIAKELPAWPAQYFSEFTILTRLKLQETQIILKNQNVSKNLVMCLPRFHSVYGFIYLSALSAAGE